MRNAEYKGRVESRNETRAAIPHSAFRTPHLGGVVLFPFAPRVPPHRGAPRRPAARAPPGAGHRAALHLVWAVGGVGGPGREGSAGGRGQGSESAKMRSAECGMRN